jgi:rod shape-determining protein MreD
VIRVVLKTAVLLAFTTLIQYTVGIDLRVGGASPQLLFLLPVAAGIVGGSVEGAVVGFCAGMAVDLLTTTPFGLTALVGTLVGAAVGVATGNLVREVWWFSAVVALCASAVAVMLYAVLGAVLGNDQFLHVGLPAVVIVVAVVNAVLAVPAVRLARWALDEGGERVAIGGRR